MASTSADMPNPRAGRWLGTTVAALAAAAVMAVPAAAEPAPEQATPNNPAPTAQAPTTGTPANDTPAASPPAVQAPAPAPVVKAPATEAPTTPPPARRAPAVPAPAADQPSWDAPAAAQPAAQPVEVHSGASAPEDEAVDADAVNRLLCSLAGSLADDLLVGGSTEGAICRGAGEDVLRGLTGSFTAPGEVTTVPADSAATAAESAAAREGAVFEDQVAGGAQRVSLGTAPASRQVTPPNLLGEGFAGTGSSGDVLLGLTDLDAAELDGVLGRASGTIASRDLDTRVLGQAVDSEALLSALSLDQVVDKEQTATLLGKAVDAR